MKIIRRNIKAILLLACICLISPVKVFASETNSNHESETSIVLSGWGDDALQPNKTVDQDTTKIQDNNSYSGASKSLMQTGEIVTPLLSIMGVVIVALSLILFWLIYRRKEDEK